MNVKELIIKLLEYDPNARVYVLEDHPDPTTEATCIREGFLDKETQNFHVPQGIKKNDRYMSSILIC